MADTSPEDAMLLIRCPSCGQRFKVGDDLLNRTVECGGCEHRFRIDEEVIVRGKRFYPGEHKDPSLNRFQRVPLAISSGPEVNETVRYGEAPDPTEFEPAPPQRIIAGLAGVAIMLLIGMLLMLGASRGGALDGMPTPNRMVMGGFAGLLGSVLLVYANPKARGKAILWGILLTGGLISLPLVFSGGSVPLQPDKPVTVEVNTESMEDPVEPERTATDDLRDLIGTGPLEDEIARLEAEGGETRAAGVWLRGLNVSNKIPLRDYILRATSAGPQTHFYPRGDGNYLVVVTGIQIPLAELGRICGAFGKVLRTYPEISVVEVKVDNTKFVAGSIEKLTDRSDPAFYDLNKRELESIDVNRISDAVTRLIDAEPTVYRTDINRRMVTLLGEDWVDFKEDLCRALMVWAGEPGPAGETALEQAKELRRQSRKVPTVMVALAVSEKTPGVLSLVDELWAEKPNDWEALYAEIGPEAEAKILERFPSAEGNLKFSAVMLLGKVGGEASLPVLNQARDGADPELTVLIQNATEAIKKRSSR